jgi:hypothetical protein
MVAIVGSAALLGIVYGRSRPPPAIDPADPGGSAVLAGYEAWSGATEALRAGDEASARLALERASGIVARARALFHPYSGLHLVVPRDACTGEPRTVEAYQRELDELERAVTRTRALMLHDDRLLRSTSSRSPCEAIRCGSVPSGEARRRLQARCEEAEATAARTLAGRSSHTW